MSRQEDLEKELEIWQRRLQKRREQKALLGISADPGIDIEIEDIEATIERLQAELAESRSVPAQPEVAASPAVSPPVSPIAEPDPELASLRAQPRIFLCKFL